MSNGLEQFELERTVVWQAKQIVKLEASIKRLTEQAEAAVAKEKNRLLQLGGEAEEFGDSVSNIIYSKQPDIQKLKELLSAYEPKLESRWEEQENE